MTYLLLTFLVILLVPLLAASWRMSLLGLSLQGLLLGWMALRDEHVVSVHAVVLFADLVLLRGILLPRYLARVLRARNVPGRNEVIAANFLSWTLAGTLVFLAFRFARVACGPGSQQAITHVAVACAAIALGLLVLASRNTVLSQIIGFLRVENGIMLFELASPAHFPLPVHVGISLVFLLTALTLARFFRQLVGIREESIPPAPKATL